MDTLFAYGTLMCEEIMAEVCGQSLKGHPATLHGYARLRVRGEHYPGLVQGGSTPVDGALYRGITIGAWQRLDRFEGDMYERRTVEVLLEDNTLVAASTYLVKADYLHRLENRAWDYERFLLNGKGEFRRAYKGYGNID